MKRTTLSGLLTSAATLLLPHGAVAQEAAPPQAETEASETADAESVPTDAAIIVTGSRVARAGYSAPTPVTVMRADSLQQKAPSSLSDALNQAPIFTGSISNSQDRNSASNRVRTGNYLNLRTLGPQRALVLQDGLRLPPTGNAGGTDANMIPQLLIERIDVVTGGASAAYGSDAVSGVVNFVIDKKFDGMKFLAQRGVSSRGDNGSYRIGGAFGTSLLDDRMHIEFSAERFKSDGIPIKGSREGVDDLYAVIGSGTAVDPFRNVSNVRFSTVADGGYILAGPAALRGKQFLPNGRIGAFDPGTPTGRAGLAYGGDGAVFPFDSTSLVAASTTNQFFGRLSYDFAGGVSAYVQGSYNYATNSDASINLFRAGTGGGTTIYSGNAFLNPADQAQFGASPSLTISRYYSDLPRYEVQQSTRAVVVNAGLTGPLGGTFKWDVDYTYGRTRFNNSTLDLNLQRYYAAVDAVVNPANGNIVCRIALTNPGKQDGCIPFNALGFGRASSAAIGYVLGKSEWQTINVMHDVEASISGEPFSTWAGPVSIVLGGEYRHQSLVQTTNSDPGTPVDFSGIRGVPLNTFAFGQTNVSSAVGEYSIKEAFGEVVVPLAKDSFIGESLELNGAFRYTDYSTSGSVKTWKLGATYEPGAGLRFRSTLSRDIRAPTLYELFAGRSLRVQAYSDRLTGTLANYNEVNSGNSGLRPEIGTTLTAGVVFQPEFLPNFAISVDYFRIRIRDAIASQFTSIQVLDLCAASNYTSLVCSQVIRPLGPTNTSPANFPSQVNVFQNNVATIRTEGIDFEASYRADLFGGMFSTRLLGTRLLHYTTKGSATAAEVEYAGVADFSDTGGIPFPMPKLRGNLEVSYSNGGVTVSAQERYIGGYKRSGLFVYAQNTFKPVVYTDLNLSFDVKNDNGRSYQFFFTVNNLFDRGYPIVPLSSNPGLAISTFRSIYDVTGRAFTAGVRVKL